MNDRRLSDIILPYSDQNTEDADVIILSVPTDEGVRRNGGRVGAAQAPKEIITQFLKLTPFSSFDSIDVLTAIGPEIGGATLEEIHERAKEAAAKFISRGKKIIALGGGHDITYPLATGFYDGIGKKEFTLINIDAHLDVREKKNGLHHSGSSFRILIEENTLPAKNFTEFGIQQFAFAQDHLNWITEQGTQVKFFDDLYGKHISREFETYLSSEHPNYVSFDIDSIRSGDAPGSSAPSPIGLRAEDAVHICYHAALNRNTRMLDIAEVNPLFDLDNRTAKLAARMMTSFLSGLKK